VLEPRQSRVRPISKFLQLDDQQLEIELTPNRGDCLSIMGLARELAVLTDARYTPLVVKQVAAKSRRKLSVTLGAKNACARYTGRVIEGINTQAATPLWMKERLRRSGVRSIHPVVDITNYVMLEFGQPMHAFDLDKLSVALPRAMRVKMKKLSCSTARRSRSIPADLVIAMHAASRARRHLWVGRIRRWLSLRHGKPVSWKAHGFTGQRGNRYASAALRPALRFVATVSSVAWTRCFNARHWSALRRWCSPSAGAGLAR